KLGNVSAPPNMTVTCRAASYAMAWWQRGAGPVVARNVQSVPFHSQVCASVWRLGAIPPNHTGTPRDSFEAIAVNVRGDGACKGLRSVHDGHWPRAGMVSASMLAATRLTAWRQRARPLAVVCVNMDMYSDMQRPTKFTREATRLGDMIRWHLWSSKHSISRF